MNDVNYEALRQMSDEQRQMVIDYLNTSLQHMKERSDNVELMMGLETLLQVLGAEGYEFS